MCCLLRTCSARSRKVGIDLQDPGLVVVIQDDLSIIDQEADPEDVLHALRETARVQCKLEKIKFPLFAASAKKNEGEKIRKDFAPQNGPSVKIVISWSSKVMKMPR